MKICLTAFIALFAAGSAHAGVGRNLLICGNHVLINQSEQSARPFHTEYIFAHDLSDDGHDGIHNLGYLGYAEQAGGIEAEFLRDDRTVLSVLIPEALRADGQQAMVRLSTGESVLCRSTPYTQRLWLKKLPQ